MSTQLFDFLPGHITQGHVVTFADEKVNLKREHAQKYRDQVNNLRDNLDRYISEHPDMGIVKMLLSGSLAKGTALRTISDVDVAVYVKGDSAPHELGALLNWLVERLRKTYHQMAPGNINVDGPAVVMSFGTNGIKVDVVPILYEGDPQWRGYLWDRRSGEKILTSIPQHIEFIGSRKKKQPTHFAQCIRLAKWWARQRAREDQNFNVRSFIIELILAKVADSGKVFGDYQLGLEEFFLYIQKTGLKERIAFDDFYNVSELPRTQTATVEIIDPVNPKNNVASDMSEVTRKLLVNKAEEALDALSYAKTSQTKGDALQCWQDVMGSSFNA